VTLRTPFSLIHSEFNEFLFAPIGEEQNGMSLSVISALTRLGIDPWEEAARLSTLPKAIAAGALAPMIARLPGGGWQVLDTQKIADRLIGLLPQRGSQAQPLRTGRKAMNSLISRAALWWICLFLIAATLVAIAIKQPLLTGREDAAAAVSGTLSQ
jgi:hypothetical protein